MIALALLLCLVTFAGLHLPQLPPAWVPLAVLLLLPLARRVPGLGEFRYWLPALLLVQLSLTIHHGQQWLDQVLATDCERQEVVLEGRVSGLIESRTGLGGGPLQRFRLDVTSLVPGHCAGPQRVLLYAQPPVSPGDGEPPEAEDSLRPGDLLRLRAVLKRPWSLQNPYGSNAQRRLFAEGLHATGSVRELEHLSVQANLSDQLPFGARLARVRERLSQAISQAVPGDVGVLLRALLVGDRRTLDNDDWERLRLFGITHLMVISGMHISLVAGLGWLAGRAASRAGVWFGVHMSWLFPLLLAAVPAIAYAQLSGLALPAQRALLMLLPSLLLLSVGRARRGAEVLALAVAVLVLLQPTAVLAPGFWLSVAAVALLLWLSAWQAPRPLLLQLIILHGYMVIAMLPLGLLFFSQTGTLGGLVNLIAVPLVAWWVLPLGLAGVAAELLAPGVSDWCWRTAAAPLQILWWSLGYWQPLLAEFTVLRATPSLAALCLAMTAVLLLPLPLMSRRLALAAALLLPLASGPDRRPEAAAYVHVFDVGQGTAVLVRDGKHSMLVDTGGGGAGGPDLATTQILPYLRAQGVSSLDLLVLSHFDADHSAGAGSLEAAMPIGERWVGPLDVPGSRSCRPGLTRRLGQRSLVRALSLASHGDSDNNGSCVVLLEINGARLLLPGDIDRHRERDLVAYWGEALQAPMLLAGHHGSSTSSSRLWLRVVDPADIVFTTARANRFGHPGLDVVRAVDERGITRWNTARHGALDIIPAEKSWRLAPTRHALRPFWWLWEEERH